MPRGGGPGSVAFVRKKRTPLPPTKTRRKKAKAAALGHLLCSKKGDDVPWSKKNKQAAGVPGKTRGPFRANTRGKEGVGGNWARRGLQKGENVDSGGGPCVYNQEKRFPKREKKERKSYRRRKNKYLSLTKKKGG